MIETATTATPIPSAEVDPFALVREDLVEVERALLEDAVSPVEAITEIGRYLQESGGKRIRPALVLLASRMGDCGREQRVRLAAIVEMIHAATLIHDDIIDAADTRRGRPSTNARWGNPKAVLGGDWLYMQAFRLALRERHFGVLDALIGLTQAMVEGEMLQLEMAGKVVTAAQHLELMERKTARLFAVSSQLGAMASNRDPATVARLDRFGRHLGLAFQMVDDILDYTATSSTLGKPIGNDLREGKMTLPAIYAYQSGTAAERALFETAMREAGYESAAFARIREAIGRTGALDRARAESRDHAAQALAALEELPDSPWRSALALLPVLVIERDH